MFTIGAGFARQGAIPGWVGIWSANRVTAGLGLFLLPRMERMPGSSKSSAAFAWVRKLASLENFFRMKTQALSGLRNGSASRGRIFSRRKRAAQSLNFSTFICCAVSSITLFC